VRQFGYRRPKHVREALLLAAEQDQSMYLGGGTNLVDLMKRGVASPTRLVDVRFLRLGGIRPGRDGRLVLGGMATNSAVAAHPDVRRRYPALSQAVLAGASGQLRNMATVAGNLMQRTRCAYFTDPSEPCNKREPGSGCPAITGAHHNHAILGRSDRCAATHPSDMAVALAAFDAVVHYETLDGAGEIPLSEFYPPVGDTPHHETALPPNALVTAVSLPESAISPRSAYHKVRERASHAFATVSIAADLDLHNGAVRGARIALGGLASRPWRAAVAEAELRGAPAVPERFRAAAESELSAARPLPGNEYKVTLACDLIETALTELADGAS
jgi:xanthine dehydrogenase YagS FAD-binding subunit